MIAAIRTIRTLLFCLAALLSSHIYAIGLYDASYENNLLKIPLIKVGDVVYEVTMIREESAELARIGCVDYCFRLASAEVARDYASSIYSFYDASTSTATIDNLWFESRVYKVSLRHLGQLNGGDYFSLVNADQKQGLPVYLTSYENKNNIGFDETMVSAHDLIKSRVDPSEAGWNERSVAFGDFLQNYTTTVFVSSGRARGLFESSRKNSMWDYPGIGYFLGQNAGGEWVDISNLLFSRVEDRETCISVSYTLVADFNNDGKPDLYLACNGIDFELSQTERDALSPELFKATQVSDQVLFLSTSSGRYERKLMGLNIYGHKAAAADIDGDGKVDIITTDAWNTNNRLPFLLRGSGDGTFKRDDSFISSRVMLGDSGHTNWNVFIVPTNNSLSLVLAYATRIDSNTALYKQLPGGTFDFDSPVLFELVRNAKNKLFSYPLDFIFANGNFYLHGAFSDQPIAEEWSILKFSMNGKFMTRIHSFLNANSDFKPYSAQIKPTNRGTFIAYTAGCSRDLAQGICAMDVPID